MEIFLQGDASDGANIAKVADRSGNFARERSALYSLKSVGLNFFESAQ